MNALKNWKTSLGGVLVLLGQTITLPTKWAWVNAALTGIGGLLVGVAAADAPRAKP